MRIGLAIITSIAFCALLPKAAIGSEQPIVFHPITQAQYDAILGLTEGEPVISEARLIASGIAALKGIAAGLKLGFSASWLPSFFSNFGGTQRNATKDVLQLQDGYPLCVVNVQDEMNNGRTDSQEQLDTHNRTPLVKCVVVVKQDPTENEEHYSPPTTTRRPENSYHNYEYSNYNYGYPPWYNNHYYRPQNSEDSYQNEASYNEYTLKYGPYPNTYESSEEEQDYYQHSKPQYTHNNKLKSHKPVTKNRKHQPTPSYHEHYDYTLSPTKKRTKTKRDQYTTHTRHQNYAKISNHPGGGYQPAAYPQFSYQNQYPKVSYSPSYNYPSPVYVRSPPNIETMPQSYNSGESEENSQN